MSLFLSNIFIFIISLFFSLLLVILIHEVGHLIGGLISGYEFSYFKILGIVLSKDKHKISLIRTKMIPTGQCILFSDDLDKNPGWMIAGGCILNVTTGVISLLILLLCDIEYLKIVDSTIVFNWWLILVFTGVINLVLGMYNFFGKKNSMDGETFSEVISDKMNAASFNCLMFIYSELCKGKAITEIDDKYFITRSARSSIMAELTYYSCLKRIVIFDKNGSEENIKHTEECLEILSRCRYEFVKKEAISSITKLQAIKKRKYQTETL